MCVLRREANGSVISAMDPPGDFFEVYSREFDARYNGGRAGGQAGGRAGAHAYGLLGSRD